MTKSREERIELARQKAYAVSLEIARLESLERKDARKKETSQKIILGSAVIAAIKAGRITESDYRYMLLPGISEKDQARLSLPPLPLLPARL